MGSSQVITNPLIFCIRVTQRVIQISAQFSLVGRELSSAITPGHHGEDVLKAPSFTLLAMPRPSARGWRQFGQSADRRGADPRRGAVLVHRNSISATRRER